MYRWFFVVDDDVVVNNLVVVDNLVVVNDLVVVLWRDFVVFVLLMVVFV